MAFAYLLNKNWQAKQTYDLWVFSFAHVGFLFGILGLLSGMIWAKFTWGEAWSNDPKQNASALALLLYGAYFMLRLSVPDRIKKANISAIYNIFGCLLMLPLLFLLPRLTDSLHPGSGGNPGFNAYDLDDRLRTVFYPAIIGWGALGLYLTILKYQIQYLKFLGTKS